MAMILDGKIPRDNIQSRLAEFTNGLALKPTLAILQVGNRPDSESYIAQKKKFAQAVGAVVIHKRYPESVEEQEIIADINKYNADSGIHGIILQIPIPAHLDKDKLIEEIDPIKDVDGLTSKNIKSFFLGDKKQRHLPATAKGVVSLLDYYGISIEGKKVVVIGRSMLVGKPVALALLNRNATVTIAHKATRDLASITASADILVVAIGDPQFIDGKYVSPGQIVVDIGINNVNGKLVGDVNRKDIEALVQALTPVPGGVGPMTVASLFENLIDAYRFLENL